MGILLGDHNLYELSYEQKFVRAAEKVVHPGIHICFNYIFQYTRIEPVMAFLIEFYYDFDFRCSVNF